MRPFIRFRSVRFLAALTWTWTGLLILGSSTPAHADNWSSEPSSFDGTEGWSSGDPAGAFDDSEADASDDGDPNEIPADAPPDPSSWRAAPPSQANGYQAQGFTPSTSTAPMEQSQFEQVLNPYGSWLQVDGLGRVWQPSPGVVGNNFTPYVTGGSWVYTPAGWSFQSQWDWGWATFHYGRWYQSPSSGWVWWPNRVWGPSWVDWRTAPGYVGWAPLPPPGYSISFGLGAPCWSFAAVGSFGRPWVARHLVYPRRYYGPAYGGYRGGWGWYRGPAWRHGAAGWGGRSPNRGGNWHGARPSPGQGGHWGPGSGGGPRGGGRPSPRPSVGYGHGGGPGGGGGHGGGHRR